MLIVALIVVAGIWASTQDAYDSVTARILLIPQGARLIGNYDSVVACALVVWPDGSQNRAVDAHP